ncbi:MAG: hypothetical protein ACFE9R_02830 [Candidatus Hermodarchaeota archaeon]
MVYFHIKGLGFNCGQIKDQCSTKFPSCIECIKNRLIGMSFELDPNFEIYEINSNEENLKIEQEQIWQKFLDVLNIKHVLVMDKASGLTLLNYTVSGVDLDANLLSGFIQANITFSESNELVNDKHKPHYEYQFYEFQYKNFNIILKDGDYIRLCLILDNKASSQLKTKIFQFLELFESQNSAKLVQFQETGIIDFGEMVEPIIKTFDIHLVFPMTIAHSIPPQRLESLNQNLIQKAIFNLGTELLSSKPFFFINNLLHRLKRIVKIEDSLVIYNIYQLLDKEIIIPTSIETIASNIEIVENLNNQKEHKIKSLSSMIVNNEDFDELEAQVENVDSESAKKLMKGFIKNGKDAEKDLAYEIAKNQYQKALLVAKKIDFKENIPKISQYIFNLNHRSKQIELEFIIEMAESAEKKGDFINSINNYQKALKIMDDFLVYNILDSRAKKFKKKIQKLRTLI